MTLLTKLFQYVLLATKKYNIDESHGLSHSMNILNFANDIYEAEVLNKPHLKDQKRIIYTAAVLHDMCDKKYMNEDDGIQEISEFLSDKMTQTEINATKNIIQTMSYSKVKKFGYPELKEYQTAYHIVREADLLSAYDFDRCMIYNMNMDKSNKCVYEAFSDADKLFTNRVLKHNEDNLFVTEYSKQLSRELHGVAINRINAWRRLLSH